MNKSTSSNQKRIRAILLPKINNIKSKFSIDLYKVLDNSKSTILHTPNCGISSNCHSTSSECCSRH